MSSANYRPDCPYGVIIPKPADDTPDDLPGASALRAYLAEQTHDVVTDTIRRWADRPLTHWDPA